MFHINNHPKYSIMDIHTEYADKKLHETNFTHKDFAFEPFDKRQEEFNKRGMNIQNIRTVDDCKQSLKLVDKYMEMKESVFDDYDIKIHGGNSTAATDYEENMKK